MFSHYRLPIGAYLSPFVRVLEFLLYPIAKPVAAALDYFLGPDHPTVYRRAELKELTKRHLMTEDAHGTYKNRHNTIYTHPYICTYIHTCKNRHNTIYTHIHPYVYTYILTYKSWHNTIYTHIHTYVVVYIHTYIPLHIEIGACGTLSEDEVKIKI